MAVSDNDCEIMNSDTLEHYRLLDDGNYGLLEFETILSLLKTEVSDKIKNGILLKIMLLCYIA